MIGFNVQTTSDWNGPSPFIEWAFRHNMPNTFSMCLLPAGAYLTIGEDLSNPSYPYQWSNLVEFASFGTQKKILYFELDWFGLIFFLVQLNNITVNGFNLANNANDLSKMIIDTGSTAVTLSSPVFYNFANILRKMCSTTNLVGVCNEPKGKSLLDGVCFPMTSKDVDAFPSMTFYIDSVKPLVLSPSFYLMPATGNSTTIRCLGIQPVDPIYFGTLGIAFLQAFNVALDPFNSLVGFAELSTCNN